MSFDYNGKTALITGASSGIGEEFARQLATKGMHLVLVARSEGKLQTLAASLISAYGIRAQVLPADLGEAGAAQRLLQACEAQGLSVDLLVNNAGFGTYGRFEEIPAERDRELIQVNVAAVSDLAHVFIPPMLARGSGALINVASSAAFQPTPWFAVYGASKAFVLSLSESLWALYRKRGIRVLALCPGPVATGFFDATQSNINDAPMFQRTMTAEQVVRQGLQTLERGHSFVVTGWLNWITAFLPRLGPRALVAWMSEILMRPADHGK